MPAYEHCHLCVSCASRVQFFRWSEDTCATCLADWWPVFKNEDSDDAIYADLRTIEADLRDQYRLVYNPAELRHDGAFHRVELKAPERVESIAVRAGYYAPLH